MHVYAVKYACLVAAKIIAIEYAWIPADEADEVVTNELLVAALALAFNFPSARKFKQIAVKVKRIESLNDQYLLLPWEFFPLGCADGIS